MSDTEVNRNPIWIVPGASGSEANYRRLLRGPGEGFSISGADEIMFHHPTFGIWYLRGIAGIRALATPAERGQAIEFLMSMNTREGRRTSEYLAMSLMLQGMERARVPVSSLPQLPGPRNVGGGAHGFVVTEQMRQTARGMVDRLRQRGSVIVNIGGNPNVINREPVEAINLNPLVSDTLRNPGAIPNLVRAPGEYIDELFVPGSVDRIISNNIEGSSIDWETTIRAAQRVLRPGGIIEVSPFGTNRTQIEGIQRAMEQNGFLQIQTFGNRVTGVKR